MCWLLQGCGYFKLTEQMGALFFGQRKQILAIALGKAKSPKIKQGKASCIKGSIFQIMFLYTREIVTG